jgi:hypothetical protein
MSVTGGRGEAQNDYLSATEICRLYPGEVACMTEAYEDALRVLCVGRQDPVTESIAKKIIGVTQRGEGDPKRICARALAELESRPRLIERKGGKRLHAVY